MCGIFGIVRETPAKFDYPTFCTLGIANDSRGGDSCGVFIDGKLEYGVGKQKFFEDFFTQSTVLQDVKYSKIALGHCRKASVGVVNAATAQPVVIQNENNETEFVLLHNGTIYNYKELAEKHIPDIDITGMTDSQVMARIFYYCGYDVLTEYNGGAVFFIVDYREEKPKVMFFKGASKKNDYFNATIEEERPLYMCVTNGEFVFSSIPSYLLALRPDSTLYTAANNVLSEFKDGNVYGIKKYDRSEKSQSRSTVINNGFTQNIFLDYIRYDYKKGLYYVGTKLMQGLYWISQYGGCYNAKPHFIECERYYFFQGIAIAYDNYYQLIWKLYTKSTKQFDEFVKDNFLRLKYLSKDRLFQKDNCVYQMVSPISYRPYNGDFIPIHCNKKYVFKDGNLSFETYAYNVPPTSIERETLNIKEFKKLWQL